MHLLAKLARGLSIRNPFAFCWAAGWTFWFAAQRYVGDPFVPVIVGAYDPSTLRHSVYFLGPFYAGVWIAAGWFIRGFFVVGLIATAIHAGRWAALPWRLIGAWVAVLILADAPWRFRFHILQDDAMDVQKIVWAWTGLIGTPLLFVGGLAIIAASLLGAMRAHRTARGAA